MVMKVETDIRAEAFNQRVEHTIFVEGDANSIDPVTIKALFKDIIISVKPLGKSSHIRGVSESLHAHHPHYYFLIDRDHHDHGNIEKHWSGFPDPDKKNLLIWRRRELENYFLIPEYLERSAYLSVSEDELRKRIREESQKRLFIDATNMVIIEIREQLKEKWVDVFKRTEEFTTKDAAIDKLRNTAAFNAQLEKTGDRLQESTIIALFEEMLEKLTGGRTALEYDSGQWLELLSGKEIYASVIPQCFKVKAQNGEELHKKEKRIKVATELLQQDLSLQPADFQQLHHLIISKLGQS